MLFSKLLFRKKTKIFFITHSLDVWFPLKNNIWSSVYWLDYAFKLKRDNTANIVLGGNIQKNLKAMYPDLNVKFIDHPSTMLNNGSSSLALNTPIKMATVCNASIFKGTQLLFELEKKLQTNNVKDIELHHIGAFRDKNIIAPDDTKVLIHGNGEKWLKFEELNSLIDMMHYGLYFFPRGSYKLTASGSLFNSLSHLKPVIAIRNSYFEYIFEKMGNIGYLCDSLDEIVLVIQNIVKHPDNSVYKEQQNNIREGYKHFSVEAIEKQLREIFIMHGILEI